MPLQLIMSVAKIGVVDSIVTGFVKVFMIVIEITDSLESPNDDLGFGFDWDHYHHYQSLTHLHLLLLLMFAFNYIEIIRYYSVFDN